MFEEEKLSLPVENFNPEQDVQGHQMSVSTSRFTRGFIIMAGVWPTPRGRCGTFPRGISS